MVTRQDTQAAASSVPRQHSSFGHRPKLELYNQIPREDLFAQQQPRHTGGFKPIWGKPAKTPMLNPLKPGGRYFPYRPTLQCPTEAKPRSTPPPESRARPGKSMNGNPLLTGNPTRTCKPNGACRVKPHGNGAAHRGSIMYSITGPSKPLELME